MTHYSTKENLFPLHGGCACGHIRYTLLQPPILVHCCHCTFCQLETGGTSVLNAIVESTCIQLQPSQPAGGSFTKADGPPKRALSPAFADLTNSQPIKMPSPSERPQPILVSIPSESGIGQCIARCPVCFVALWSHYADAGKVMSYLRASTLDKAGEIDPDVHIFTRSRRTFAKLDDGKPQFEEYYPDRSAFYREDVLERVKQLETKKGEWRESMIKAMTPKT